MKNAGLMSSFQLCSARWMKIITVMPGEGWDAQCTPAKTVDMTRKIINANDRLQDSLQSLVSTLHDANDDYLHRKIFL